MRNDLHGVARGWIGFTTNQIEVSVPISMSFHALGLEAFFCSSNQRQHPVQLRRWTILKWEIKKTSLDFHAATGRKCTTMLGRLTLEEVFSSDLSVLLVVKDPTPE